MFRDEVQETLELQDKIFSDETCEYRKIIYIGDLYLSLCFEDGDDKTKSFAIWNKYGFKLKEFIGVFKDCKMLDDSNFLIAVGDFVEQYRKEGLFEIQYVSKYQFSESYEGRPFNSIDDAFNFIGDWKRTGLLVLKNTKYEWLYSFLKGDVISSGFDSIEFKDGEYVGSLDVRNPKDDKYIANLLATIGPDGIVKYVEKLYHDGIYYNKETIYNKNNT